MYVFYRLPDVIKSGWPGTCTLSPRKTVSPLAKVNFVVHLSMEQKNLLKTVNSFAYM